MDSFIKRSAKFAAEQESLTSYSNSAHMRPFNTNAIPRNVEKPKEDSFDIP